MARGTPHAAARAWQRSGRVQGACASCADLLSVTEVPPVAVCCSLRWTVAVFCGLGFESRGLGTLTWCVLWAGCGREEISGQVVVPVSIIQQSIGVHWLDERPRAGALCMFRE